MGGGGGGGGEHCKVASVTLTQNVSAISSHVTKSPRPSSSVIADYKLSTTTGGKKAWEWDYRGQRMRL